MDPPPADSEALSPTPKSSASSLPHLLTVQSSLHRGGTVQLVLKLGLISFSSNYPGTTLLNKPQFPIKASPASKETVLKSFYSKLFETVTKHSSENIMQVNLKENGFSEVPQQCPAEYRLFDINRETIMSLF